MPATDRVLVPEIELDGSSLPEVPRRGLRGVRVEAALWMPARCTLRFLDPYAAVADDESLAVGKTVTVSIPSGDGDAAVVFDGEITDITLNLPGRGRRELVVGCLDASHRLGGATTLRTFQNQTISDVVTTIADEAGLSADADATGEALPYLLQTSSNHAFLWELANRTGFDWWVADGTLSFKKRASEAGVTLTYGEDLLEFRVRYSGAGKANQLTVQGWDRVTQAQVSGTDESVLTGSAAPDIGSTAPLAVGGRSAAISAWGQEVATGGYGVVSAEEAAAVAGALASRVDAAEVVARGMCEANPDLKVGTYASIAGVGSRASGTYFVTSVEHVFGLEGTLTTRFGAGNKAPVGLADLMTTGASARPSWGSTGLVAGVVTNVEDPDAEAKVRVRFPSLSDEDESGWARVVSPGGGPQRGIQFMPEVDDEVLIGFEHGDHRFPVVLGGLWSAVNGPAETDTASPVVKRVIKSRLGNAIELSDGDGEDTQHVSITLVGGGKLRLGEDKADLEMPGKPITIKTGSGTVSIDDQGAVTVKGSKVTIEATGDLALSGANVEIKANANLTLTASAQFKASGNAGANLESSAIAVVKGSMVQIN